MSTEQLLKSKESIVAIAEQSSARTQNVSVAAEEQLDSLEEIKIQIWHFIDRRKMEEILIIFSMLK